MNMRLTAKRLLGIALLSTSHLANAQTTVGSGPYYATPSWDQTMPAGTRFVVLSNFNSEAVLDRETGLVWQRTPALSSSTSGVIYSTALRSCYQQTTGGKVGWRLPNVSELSSLFNPVPTAGSFLPAGHPFLGIDPTAAYWSSTSFTYSEPAHLYVQALAAQLLLAFPSVDSVPSSSYWCVRGPSGAVQ